MDTSNEQQIFEALDNAVTEAIFQSSPHLQAIANRITTDLQARKQTFVHKLAICVDAGHLELSEAQAMAASFIHATRGRDALRPEHGEAITSLEREVALA